MLNKFLRSSTYRYNDKRRKTNGATIALSIYVNCVMYFVILGLSRFLPEPHDIDDVKPVAGPTSWSLPLLDELSVGTHYTDRAAGKPIMVLC